VHHQPRGASSTEFAYVASWLDIIWIGTMIRIESVKEPFIKPALAVKGARVLARADAMGLLRDKELQLTLDASTIGRLAPRLRRAGIAGEVAAFLGTPVFEGDPALLERYLDRLIEALETSPVPDSEWKHLTNLLGMQLLPRLLGISPVSVRRYSRAARSTPDDVAGRLHWVALIVGDLAGAYNDMGIRQWFDRRRAQLDGQTPAQVLAGAWKPDDPGPRQVRRLAYALTASPAT
jgi:hypothetical protein